MAKGINSIRNQRGYTLIELMFAIVIIAISVLALYQMYITGTTIMTEEKHRRAGLENAQAIMEEMQFYALKYDSIPRNMSGYRCEDLVPAEEGQRRAIQGCATLEIRHSMDRDVDNKPLYSHVRLLYEWEERSGREQRLELQSYF